MEKKYKTGYVQGTFDLFHIGHLNLLKKAKDYCEYLIVGVASDELNYKYKGEYPYIPYSERAVIVKAIKYVDQVEKVDFLNEDKLKAWELYHYDCHFSGDDHAGEWEELTKALRNLGSDIVFFPYTEETSSTKIKMRVKSTILYEGNYFFSFDVFDTLITRKTATPRGIFSLMQQYLQENEKFCLPDRVKNNFYDLRIYYERAARHEFCDREDITLYEIYEIFAMYEMLDSQQIQILTDLEKQLELDNVVGIEKNIAQVKALKKAGHRIVFISDMYLEKDIIRKMLTKVNLELRDIPLYVSSAYGRTKSSNSLYQVVQKQENAEYSNWVHCGDNAIADIKVAKEMGIHTIHDKTTALSKRERIILQSKERDPRVQLLLGKCKLDRLFGRDVVDDEQIDNLVYAVEHDSVEECLSLPYSILKHKIAIYGAGKLGQHLYDRLQQISDKKCVAWIDKNYILKQQEGLPVEPVEHLNEVEFDQIMIAVLNRKIAEEIKNTLVTFGIERRKIVWVV
ncbi:HAD-IA family hydrolase [Propionispira raffinosivorans]|uniref:HAD-IA family hydrolase n=1 Tax=Propionispira raffinosivorans TaxID=86959 RepID=UPI000377352F|nr:HAD-IA family hydrolase [Propionispira raffinosivorans]